MWNLNDYIKTWLRSHRCANNMHICTASQKSAVKQEYPVQTFLQANAHFIRTVWCSLPLYLVWERRSHTFSLVLHSWTWPLQPIMFKWRQNSPSTGIASWSRIDTTAVVLKLFWSRIICGSRTVITNHLVPGKVNVPNIIRSKVWKTRIDTNATWKKWLWEILIAIFRKQQGK